MTKTVYTVTAMKRPLFTFWLKEDAEKFLAKNFATSRGAEIVTMQIVMPEGWVE